MRHAANAALFLCAASSLFKTTQAVYFYMYSGPNFDWIKNCSVNHAKSVEALRHNMYAGEVLFQERLEHHPERVFDDNWERAELFVVPVLMVLAYWEHWGPDPGCNGISLNEQLDITGKALLESPYFRAKGGRDHLIVSDHHGLNYMDFDSTTYFKTALANMTIAHFETPEQQGALRPWRCTIAVPYLHKAVAPLTGRHAGHDESSLLPRDKGVFFMGNMDGRPAYDLRREVAKRIIPLTQYNMTFVSTNDEEVNLYFPERCPMPACFDLPRCVDCSLHNASHTTLYSHRLQQSEFCLMISGDSPSSRRLFDAFAHGAVPIIVSNRLWHVAMPFPAQVPWPDLVYSLEDNFTEEEFMAVMATPKDTLARKRTLIKKYLREVSWNHPSSRVVDNILDEAKRYCM